MTKPTAAAVLSLTLDPAQAAMVATIAAELRPMVAEIEASPPTTQGHYGRYGGLLATVSRGSARVSAVYLLALVAAGANRAGAGAGYDLMT